MKMAESYNPLKRQQDLQTLTSIIVSWNSSRLDLFELTLPNDDLEFSGETLSLSLPSLSSLSYQHLNLLALPFYIIIFT